MIPFNIWDYLPESVFRFYAGKPLLMSKEIRGLKNKLRSGNFDWDDLKEYSRIAAYDDNHRFYETSISQYDSSIEFNKIEKAEFIGDGRGVESLNCYRRVRIVENGKTTECFEKVYKKSSIDFQKTSWFYKEVYPQIKSELRIPELITCSGSNAHVVYFEWLEELNRLNDREAILFFSELLHIFSNVKLNKFLLKEPFVISYIQDAFFDFSFQRAKIWLEINVGMNSIDVLNSLNNYVISNKSLRWQFVHGNLSSSNMLINRVLLDFDNCGYYPLEYESASFITSFHMFESVEEFESILKKYYQTSEIFTDRLTFLFFSFVFYNRERKESRKNFLYELWLVISDIIPKAYVKNER